MLEIAGANPFRVRAYNDGARVVENHGESLAAIAGEPGALEVTDRRRRRPLHGWPLDKRPEKKHGSTSRPFPAALML